MEAISEIFCVHRTSKKSKITNIDSTPLRSVSDLDRGQPIFCNRIIVLVKRFAAKPHYICGLVRIPIELKTS